MRPPALRAAPANGAESAALRRAAPFHRHHRRIRFSSRSGSILALTAGGNEFRLLIDDEFIDSDIPAIEELAAQQGVQPEVLISDGDGDWFIDLPPGAQLELPTGQVGDPGLFDAGHPAFLFGKPSHPTISDFLNYNENGGDLSKGGVDDPEVKALLDPVSSPTPSRCVRFTQEVTGK